MTDFPVRWGDGGFQEMGVDPSNEGDDFEMRGGVDAPLQTMPL